MKTKLFKLSVAAGAALLAVGVQAQGFPAKPITLIVPFAAGGPTDKVARDLAEALRKPLNGATVVVDNAAGAGSTIGSAKAFRAPADGYTLLVAHIGMATTATLYRNPGFKYDEFEYLGMINEVPMVVVGKPALAAKNWSELSSWITQNKEKVNLANAGLGAASHLCGLMLQNALKTELTTVPYKGTAPAMTDLLGGQVDLYFASLTVALPHIAAGKLKPLAVTSEKRHPALPEVATLSEQGFPALSSTVFLGVVAPAGTPEAVLDTLNKEVNESMNTAAAREALAKTGMVPQLITRAQFATFLAAERAKWSAVVKATGATVD